MRTVAHDGPPLDALPVFRALVAPLRLRVTRDGEGWPVVLGRRGRIEYHDGERLAVYTARPRVFTRLEAMPGAQLWQVGSTEARLLVPPEALEPVAGVIRARKRKQVTPEHVEKLRAGLLGGGFPAAGARSSPRAGLDTGKAAAAAESDPEKEIPSRLAPAPSWVREWFGRVAAPSESEPGTPGAHVGGRLHGWCVRPLPLDWRTLRTAVLTRDGYQCRRCRTRQGPWTVHHVIPRAQGGSDDPRNLVALCNPCHDAAELEAEHGTPMVEQLRPPRG